MDFLPLDRPTTASVAAPLRAFWAILKSCVPQSTPIDGEKARRQNALRHQARVDVDRLLLR